MAKDVVSGIKIEDGKFYLYDIRVGLTDFKIFSIIFKEFDKLIGPVSSTIIYKAVKRQTSESVKSILTTLGFKEIDGKTFDDRTIEFFLNMGVADLMSRFGWGAMKITDFDASKGFIRLCVEDSVVAESYDEEQERPVCFFIAGMIAGGAEMLLGHDVECKEVKCKACGDEHCEFVIQKGL
ncbi:MAG: V4R domain-containing protein [Halobacteriota archaeon]|nr:V4R domain-containing protein [Halobacteriota archaeon]